MTAEHTQGRKPACPQCSKPIEQPHNATIHDQGYDQRTGRQFARTRNLSFCSSQCGGDYQCGCEG